MFGLPRNLDTTLKVFQEQQKLRLSTTSHVIRSTSLPNTTKIFTNPFLNKPLNNTKEGIATFAIPTNSNSNSSSSIIPTTVASIAAAITPIKCAGNLWLERLEKMGKSLAKQKELELKRRTVGSRVDVTLGKNTANTLSAGDIRLANVRKTLNNCGVIRSDDQIKFHDAFIMATLPKIYGENWTTDSVRKHS